MLARRFLDRKNVIERDYYLDYFLKYISTYFCILKRTKLFTYSGIYNTFQGGIYYTFQGEGVTQDLRHMMRGHVAPIFTQNQAS